MAMQETENDILRRVRKIEIKTRGLSNEIFAGKYHTAFRGRGMSFSEVREYRAGDDVRDIDWNVTARSSKPHIKIYEEERELTMMLLVDVSGSRMFGTAERLKKSVMTEIAAVLAFSAAQNNDKVGCIFFSDRVEKFIPPKKGRSHILMIIRELVKFRPESARPAIERLRERGVKVFISTGRLLRHTEVVSDIEVDGYVTVNGSYCVTSDGRKIFELSFPRETLDKVFALEEKYGFQAAVMTHDDIYIDRITDRVQSIVDIIHITPSVADLKRIAATEPVLQMCPYVGEELERKIMPELPECVGTRWIDIFMDINMRGIDK